MPKRRVNDKELSVSIVIPAKNEMGGLAGLLPDLIELAQVDEIVVVDDGSTDETVDVCVQHGVRVISHPYSKGNGASIKTGARHALGDVIVFMDADGQHSAADVNRLLAELAKGYDLVVGARQGLRSQASILRGGANALYNKLATMVVGHKVEDLTSGFRAVRAEKFREFLYLLPNGFSYPTTSTMAFFRAGYSIKYLPVEVAKRIGKSHLNPFKDGVRFLLIIFKVGTLYSPLKIFFPIAIAFFTLASFHYANTYINENRFTNMSALLYVTSVLVFMMGLVSEQITALMYKSNKSV